MLTAAFTVTVTHTPVLECSTHRFTLHSAALIIITIITINSPKMLSLKVSILLNGYSEKFNVGKTIVLSVTANI